MSVGGGVLKELTDRVICTIKKLNNCLHILLSCSGIICTTKKIKEFSTGILGKS